LKRLAKVKGSSGGEGGGTAVNSKKRTHLKALNRKYEEVHEAYLAAQRALDEARRVEDAKRALSRRERTVNTLRTELEAITADREVLLKESASMMSRVRDRIGLALQIVTFVVALPAFLKVVGEFVRWLVSHP
jgi:shikimate kinase